MRIVGGKDSLTRGKNNGHGALIKFHLVAVLDGAQEAADRVELRTQRVLVHRLAAGESHGRGLEQRLHVVLAAGPAIQGTIGTPIMAFDPSALCAGRQLLGSPRPPQRELLREGAQPRLGGSSDNRRADRLLDIRRKRPPPRHAKAAASRLDEIVELVHEAIREARPAFGEVLTKPAAGRESAFESKIANEYYWRSSECALFGVSPSFEEVFGDHPERIRFIDAFQRLFKIGRDYTLT